MSERIVELKANIEKAITDYKVAVKEVMALGYQVEMQANGTAYIFKTAVVEEFGEKVNAPNSQR